MKIALVTIVKDRDLVSPITLAYLATYIREKGGFNDVKIIDANFEDPMTELKRYKPDVVGLSAMTIFIGDVSNMAQRIKEELNIPVILGGVHISTCPVSMPKCFDVAVSGEGEQTFLELMESFRREGKFDKEKLKDIKGLVFWKDDKLVQTELRPQIDPIDDIPVPDRDYMHKGYFKKKMVSGAGKHTREGTILTSRGCPFKCIFCSTAHFWKTVRFHSPERVVEEIMLLREKYKVKHYSVWDDLFPANVKRLKDIRDILKERGVLDDMTIACQARSDSINDDVCQTLKSLNTKTIGFGFESGSERVLAYLKKNTTTVEKNRQAIVTCKKYGFAVYGSLIFGTPTETIAEMRETIDFIKFAKENGADGIWCFVMTPFPGTDMWEVAKQRGKVSDEGMNWDILTHQNMDNPLLLDESISREEFKNVFLEAREELNFFRIKYIKQNIRSDFTGTTKTAITHPRDTAKTIMGVLSKNRMRISKK